MMGSLNISNNAETLHYLLKSFKTKKEEGGGSNSDLLKT